MPAPPAPCPCSASGIRLGAVTSRKSFGSDNHAGAHDAVLRSIVASNDGDAHAYGADPWTERATGDLRDLFAARGGVYFVFTGTAANVLGISLLLRPYEAVICAESAHMHVDECGAPERQLGDKLLPVPALDGELPPELVAGRRAGPGGGQPPQLQGEGITQATELGTGYTMDELRKLREFC